MSTWPDPSATVPTTDLDNDTDTLAAARVDILDAVNKLNQIIGTCDIGSEPWTDANDERIQKRITTGTTNGIVLEDANGDVITSGKTISAAAITDDDTVVPTNGAVVDYVAANGGGGTYSSSTLSNTATAGSYVDISFNVGSNPASFGCTCLPSDGADTGDFILEAVNNSGLKFFMVSSEATNTSVLIHPSNPATGYITVRVNNTGSSNGKYLVNLWALTG